MPFVRRTRLMDLTEYPRRAFLRLGHVPARKPWTYGYKVVDGLWEKTGSPAQVTGVFALTLEMDPRLRDEPEWFLRFVIDHEVQHLVGKHGFWSLVTALLCPPLLPLVWWIQEMLADRAAARCATRAEFLRGAERTHKPTRWHRFLYGTPEERTRRAKGW